jgi:hypothetical protein
MDSDSIGLNGNNLNDLMVWGNKEKKQIIFCTLIKMKVSNRKK